MTIDEMIAVLQAARAGKPIQFKAKSDPTDQWCNGNTDGMGWSFSAHDYRVKPEPREWTVRVYPQGIMSDSGKIVGDAAETIRVREVLP